ncbi:unnamed protein product [Bursaphelenchus xylophilus]|uniref:(pine wood nematode) hypothetical protein n=1 Tax=Bursaphelenchus xylophilus TaxID=6326 RepID=A0A1I7SDB6_BURXY|nr:unnamed protein product [Bursaphelenchus xylophilus]CAG9130583.1 unnamed protein product [Bursaphelenchus xylophilus]
MNSTSGSQVVELGEVVVEPRFKYSRVIKDVHSCLEGSSASCVAVHDKFLAIGFSSGHLRLFDHLGYEHFKNSLRKHKSSVTQVAFDTQGSYLISCSNDSTVSIQGIGSSEHNEVLKVCPAAKSVALSEDFCKRGSGQKFVSGGQMLIMYEKGFLGKYKGLTLFQGLDRDGFISCCSWRGSLLAFTNDTGTRVYDCTLKRMISLVQPSHLHETFFSSRFLPRHCWIDPVTLVIAWGSTVTICKVTSQSNEKNGLSMKKVEIQFMWSIPDVFISGVSFTVADPATSSSRTWEEIVVFGLTIDNAENEDDSEMVDDSMSVISDVSNITALATLACKKTNAQLLLMKPLDSSSYIVIADDKWKMRNSDLRFLNKFSLVALPSDSMYFLLGPRELIEASPFSTDDRVDWFLENKYYAEALECALKDKEALQRHSVSDIGRLLIRDLIEQGMFSRAAKILPQICDREKMEWEYYVTEFEKYGEILKLIPYLPLGYPQLEPECYESVLTAALYSKTNLFRKLVIEWNPDIYRAASIIDKALRRLNADNNFTVDQAVKDKKDDLINIYQALAHLFAYVRNFDKALVIYLLLKDKAVFGVIDKYHLFPMVKDRIVELMDINADLAIRLLLDNEDSIPAKQVVTRLSKHPKLQMAYLNRLYSRGEGIEYVDLMVKLFAEYDRPKLLSFLKKAESYKIDLALEICRKKNYINEAVFLLGRSGNRLEALDLIMKSSKDIQMAISFCSEHEDDIELWDRLIDLSLDNPQHITKILSTAGTFIDPLTVIEKMPIQIEIPGLQDLLLKILRDYELKVNVLRDSSRITSDDMFRIFSKKVEANISCTGIGSDKRCDNCGELICRPSNQGDLLILCCHHVVHEGCIGSGFRCPVCNSVSIISPSAPVPIGKRHPISSNPFGDF